MSFGSLSEEAKTAMARGAELAGTGICSGEGGMLEDEQASNSRYFYELASAQFGFSWDKLDNVQAFHFKGGQGAKTGTGGHLPGSKVTAEIAKVRGLEQGETAISPAAFPDMKSVEDFKAFADKVKDKTGGIPIGFKIAASRIEDDIDFALAVGVDYIIHVDDNPIKQIMEITNGEFATAVFDASGNKTALENGPSYMAHGGRFVLVGLSKGELSYNHPAVHAKEMTLMCSRNATTEDFEHVINIIDQFPTDSFITHNVDYSDMISNFDSWLIPETGVIKATVNFK